MLHFYFIHKLSSLILIMPDNQPRTPMVFVLVCYVTFANMTCMFSQIYKRDLPTNTKCIQQRCSNWKSIFTHIVAKYVFKTCRTDH